MQLFLYFTGFFLMHMTLQTYTNTTQNDQTIQAVVLAAGQGSRLKTGITKMITPICGQPMAVYPCKMLESMNIPCIAVIGFQKEKVQEVLEKALIKNLVFAQQKEQLGTGHALLCSKEHWNAQNILVMNGDMPLIDTKTIEVLCNNHLKTNAAISIVVSHNVDPENTYGRIVQHNDSIKIVEKKHFTYTITDHPYVNAGVYLIKRAFLEQFLHNVQQNELSHEFYITDLVEIASTNKLPVTLVPLPFDNLFGVNTFQELSQVEEIKRQDLIHYWMTQGVRFIAPATNHIDYNVTIGRGTVIYPGVQLFNGSKVGEFCTLYSHAVLDGAVLENNTIVDAMSIKKEAHEKSCTSSKTVVYSLSN